MLFSVWQLIGCETFLGLSLAFSAASDSRCQQEPTFGDNPSLSYLPFWDFVTRKSDVRTSPPPSVSSLSTCWLQIPKDWNQGSLKAKQLVLFVGHKLLLLHGCQRFTRQRIEQESIFRALWSPEFSPQGGGGGVNSGFHADNPFQVSKSDFGIVWSVAQTAFTACPPKSAIVIITFCGPALSAGMHPTKHNFQKLLYQQKKNPEKWDQQAICWFGGRVLEEHLQV